MSWISVKDTLPDEKQCVLVTNGTWVAIGFIVCYDDKLCHWSVSTNYSSLWIDGNQNIVIEDDSQEEDWDVTHWHLLPKVIL